MGILLSVDKLYIIEREFCDSEYENILVRVLAYSYTFRSTSLGFREAFNLHITHAGFQLPTLGGAFETDIS